MLWIIITLHFIVFPGQFDGFDQKNTFLHFRPNKTAGSTEPCIETAKKQLASDYWKAALKTIESGMEHGRCFDPQVALTLIEKVIQNDADEYYAFAERLYRKSLSTKSGEKYIDLIKKEARKLLPMLSDDEKKDWEDKIENNDPELAEDIKAFWVFRDPVLSTPTNERLTEHWQRITYARKEFTKNDDSVYGTDDRGTIYVKYGPPSFKRSGMLTPESTEIRSKLYDLSFFKEDISPREMFNLNMSIKQQYMPKYYEVWVYRNLDSRRPVLFLFGESANRGTFGLRKSVEEFISSGSYRMGITSSWQYDTGARGLTAGPFLQMALYNQLSTIDIYFGNQLIYYDRNWLRYMNGGLDFSSLKMLNDSYRAERELRRIQQQASAAQSTLKKRLEYIDQSYKVYRFLNEQNEPVSKVLVFSSPREKLILNDRLMYQHQNPGYKVEHAAKVFDRRAGQIYSKEAEFMIGRKPEAAKGTMLEIPASKLQQNSGPHKLLVSSEVSRVPSDGTVSGLNRDSLNRKPIIIASKIDEIRNREMTPPLNPDQNTPEVSDIIWGYRPGDKNHDIKNISFTIPKESVIPQGKNLMIYFETYHLKSDSGNLHDYQVEYLINRIKRRRTIDTGIKLTLNFSSAASTAKEILEIETSGLEPGRYRAAFRFLRPNDPAPYAERFIEFYIDK